MQLIWERNEFTLPKEFACNPSLTAEVLIYFMRESWMLLSSWLTLVCSKNRFTTRQRADLTSLGKTWAQKEPGFLPCWFLYSSFPMWRVFPASSFMSSQESAWYMRKKTCIFLEHWWEGKRQLYRTQSEEHIKQFKLRDIGDCHKCMKCIVIHQLGDLNWRNYLVYNVVSDIINS